MFRARLPHLKEKRDQALMASMANVAITQRIPLANRNYPDDGSRNSRRNFSTSQQEIYR